MKHRSLIFLIISLFVLSAEAGLAQNKSPLPHNSPVAGTNQKAIDGFASLFGNKFLSALLPQSDKRISARGDFMVSIVEIIDPRTGQIIGSRTEREVVINGIRYKAVVYGRREQMTTKLNIPIQGVLAGDTIILDESPVRVISSGEYSALGVDQSKIAGDTVAAEVGGQIIYFPNRFELDKFVYQQTMWESKVGPVHPADARSNVEASPWTEGAKTVLFMRVDFSDRPGDPTSPSNVGLTETAAQALMNNSVNPFYVNNSYGKTSLQTTVTPVLRLPKPLSEYVQAYKTSGGTGLNSILGDARDAARAAGIEPNNFSLDVVASSYDSGLTFAGVAWVGAKGSWLNGYFDLRVTSHELGHNYGLSHANLWRVSGGGSDPIAAGTDIEYGDCYDSMGNSIGCFEYQNPRIHFNTRYKRNLDWLTDANVQTVTGDGTYRIITHDTPSLSGIHALRVKRDASIDYWVELRQLFSGNSFNGALIRRHTFGTSKTQLLDMTPGTTTTGDEALLAGQSFFDAAAGLRITVLGKGGTSPETLDVKVEFNVFTNPPNTPTNLRTTFVSSSQINLAWNASINPTATSYNLRVNGSNVITGITSLSSSFTNLPQNTTYTYEVQAVNSYGASSWSAPLSVTTSATVPKAPTNVTASAVSSEQINVFWNQSPANENVTKYNLRVNGLTVISNIIYLSYPVKNLLPNTTYSFEVQAVNGLGVSAWSAPVSATTDGLNPRAPSTVTTNVVSTNQINVFWNASTSSNVTSYNLRVNGSQVITGITYLSYPVKELAPNTTYTFELQAVNSLGLMSGWTTPVSATTAPIAPPPNPPTGIVANAASSTQINVFWNASNSPNVTSYNLRVNGSDVITGITYLSYPVKNLIPGTTYTFELQAVNSLGLASAWSAPVSGMTTPIAAPTGVVANAVSSTQINVFWNASASPNITGYNLRVNGSTVITGITYLSYPVKDLTPNTAYTFELQTVSSGGFMSAWTAPVNATTAPVAPPPNAPNSVTTSVVSSTQINVFWNASTSQNVTSYNLRVDGSTVIPGITYLSYPVKDLTPNTTYTFEVQAVNSSGVTSNWTAPFSATTAPIAAPTNVSPSVVSSTQINVFWNSSASPNITSYNLRVNGSQVITGITYLSYPVKGLTPNTTYTFEVQAVNSGGFASGWSTPVNATTAPVAPPPSTPTNVVPQAASSTQINVFWNGAPAGENVVSYNLRVNGSTVIPGITYLSYPVKGLTPSTTYTFEVQAVNSSGVASNWSAPVSATTAPPLSTPTIASVQAVSSSQINVFWNGAPAGENVTSYNLRVNGGSVITGITYLSYPVKNLNPNTTYTFEVQASGPAGVSNWSAPASATTAATGASSESASSPVAETAASFIGYDPAAQGNWPNKYGGQGTLVVGENPRLPDWLQFSVAGQALSSWAVSTADQRALVKTVDGKDRAAAALYSATQFEMTFNFLDGQTHKLSLYAVDWEGNTRQQTFEIIDAASGAVIDSRQINSFNNGVYIAWQVKGKIIVRVKNTGEPNLNAVVSGVFVDSM